MKKEIDEHFNYYIDIAKFQTSMLNSRSNLFLLFHSLLIAGTAEVWSELDTRSLLLKLIFASLGVIVTLIWIWIADRTARNEKACYKKLNEYEVFVDITGGGLKKVGNRHIVGLILPLVVLVSWLLITALIISYF